MPNGAKFTIGLENQQSITALDLFISKFNLVGDAAKSIGGKIQGLLTFTAVEEGIRRTGEWAMAQNRLAISFGTTNEKIQAMKQLAMNANLDESKVTSWFETLEQKRREALKGNYDLRLSFQAMGIAFSDLQHLPVGGIFSKLMGNKDIPNIIAGTPMGNAAENLLGQGSISQFQALQRAGGGQTLDQYTQSGLDNGSIVPKEDVTELSNQWIQIKQDLANALKNLSPLGKLLMSLATILSESVLGFSRIFKGGFDTITGLINGDFTKVKKGITSIGSILLNALFGAVKIFTGLIDIASKTINNLVKKIPGLGKYAGDETINFTKYVQEAQDFYNKKMGASRDDVRGGEGLGNLATIVGTGGAGSLARGGAEGLFDLAGMAEKAGAGKLSEAMLENAVRLERLSKIGMKAGPMGTIASWMLGAIGAKNQTPNGGAPTNSLGGVEVPFNGITAYMNPTTFSGETSSQLKFGGVFGTGIQTRMIRLSEQQVSLLSEIVKNTSFLAQYRPLGAGTDNKKPAGGA